MEILAGRPDFVVETNESGCRFRFDFSKVFWNSRLQGEHARLVASFDKQDVICDGFAGVGPFAIPAAKKGCLGVFANDLNPASAESCKENAKLNRVQNKVRCYNEDGRHFMRSAVREAYASPFPPYPRQSLSANKATKKAQHERKQFKTGSPAVSSSPVNNGHIQQKPGLEKSPAVLGKFIDHFILNLPDTAIDYLETFHGI